MMIQGYNSLALMETQESDKLRIYLEKIQLASDRAEILTEQFLAFSGEMALQPKEIGLHTILLEIKRRFQSVTRNNVEIITKLHPDTRIIWIDRQRLEKSILDIMINAMDVLPEEGKITIKTDVVLPEDIPSEQDLQFESYTEISIRDTGPGMPEEISVPPFHIIIKN